MHRLFVGLRPPAAIRDILLGAMEDAIDVRWQSDEQLHLTLRFIGEVDRPVADDLADALGRVHSESFALRIAGVGCFERRSGGALWAAVEPKAPVAGLAAKIERVCQQIGLSAEHRSFHPHVTLARWNGRRSHEARSIIERQAALCSEPFDVTEFILFESRLSRHGAHYEAVATYPLNP